jgi:ApbE superfamily uncharacterized protein (UPF0280 family)
MTATIRELPDGRLHLHHGPIDCIVRAWGTAAEVGSAYAQVSAAFPHVLPDLCAELAVLRRPAGPDVSGAVARRMRAATLPFATDHFITPMAAVAGSVADHLLAALCQGRRLEKAFVNDGGDIAFHLAPGAALRCGLVTDAAAAMPDGLFALTHDLPVRGLATSGAGGRSFSLGIADSVTVLARSAAAADAAATLIANAVDLPGHPAIRRVPACALDPDSELGGRLVTREVGGLEDEEIARALAGGIRVTEWFRQRGLIHAAVLVLQGRVATVGLVAQRPPSPALPLKGGGSFGAERFPLPLRQRDRVRGPLHTAKVPA